MMTSKAPQSPMPAQNTMDFMINRPSHEPEDDFSFLGAVVLLITRDFKALWAEFPEKLTGFCN
ncbi:hypothetical protein GCM10011450_13170 [Advenella faeciporci]|uniref:Uncharacterized protein n=1 Tax=Advenella faeciporci TaxID=797535 RepID=A0A918MY51_9BURK|nr:hypothetical protein GCM10011450_13170 [Advenella faeciporci]